MQKQPRHAFKEFDADWHDNYVGYGTGDEERNGGGEDHVQVIRDNFAYFSLNPRAEHTGQQHTDDIASWIYH